MAERTVFVAGFRYTDHNGADRVAHGGEVIDFSDEDTQRGDEVGAFVVEPPEGEESTGISMDSTDDELQEFCEDAKVREVIAAAGTDAEFAHRLLAAENAATGGEPRVGVAKGLAAIVGDGDGGSGDDSGDE